jgi:hypothetical protein
LYSRWRRLIVQAAAPSYADQWTIAEPPHP